MAECLRHHRNSYICSSWYYSGGFDSEVCEMVMERFMILYSPCGCGGPAPTWFVILAAFLLLVSCAIVCMMAAAIWRDLFMGGR